MLISYSEFLRVRCTFVTLRFIRHIWLLFIGTLVGFGCSWGEFAFWRNWIGWGSLRVGASVGLSVACFLPL